MANKIKLFFVIATLCISGCRGKSETEKLAEQNAITQANSWLQLVDNGQYAESWDESADIFKSAMSKKDWEKMLQSARKPLGKVISRNIKSQHYRKTLPGVPDGEYVVIEYKTSYENKKSGIETITPMLEKDQQWHVSGYYIQ